MSMTDPIADYLTRIRNAASARHSKVDIPSSRLIREMTRILQEEGYIQSFTMIEDQQRSQDLIRIYLKYDENRKCAITGLKRISRPSLRRYAGADELPRVLNGLGIAIVSTPKGVLTEKKARMANVGGELLCHIW
ncbi:MAG TPA: 30S ribosomal protein S8 [bacterium]|nr:30S ribosomal protein S8 [bacterium]